MRVHQVFGMAGAVASALLCVVPPSVAAPAVGAVQIVQAVPGSSVDVSVDGKQVSGGVDLGTILGPYELAPGRHEIRFSDSAGNVSTRTAVSVDAGSNTDVVIHRPAAISGTPVVNTYATPQGPIGPDKARVLVAHTATVPPADVQVDGKTVFTNIANGEFAQADVPAGAHKVALLPTGQTTEPILGPLDVTLEPQTVTMVYAVGTPTNGSMQVIAHVARIASDGSVVPETMDTGSAGLASDLEVTTFGPSDGRAPAASPTWLLAGAAILLLLACVKPVGRAAASIAHRNLPRRRGS